jgi:hypothetical protein
MSLLLQRGNFITTTTIMWHVTISCHLFNGLHKLLFPLGLHNRTRHILCAKSSRRLEVLSWRFVLYSVILCACFCFLQISRPTVTAPQSSSAPQRTVRTPNSLFSRHLRQCILRRMVGEYFVVIVIIRHEIWFVR